VDPQHDDGVALTAFDIRTAAAVVSVLRGAGISAWATAEDESGEVEVRVAADDRERAMAELGARMEQVQDALRKSDRTAPGIRPTARTRRADPDPDPAPLPDPDDVHAGPPLVMERFRSMGFLTAMVIVPLMVVTLAPTLRGETARTVVLVVAVVVAAALLLRRRR
jgi:hypothetical protein